LPKDDVAALEAHLLQRRGLHHLDGTVEARALARLGARADAAGNGRRRRTGR